MFGVERCLLLGGSKYTISIGIAIWGMGFVHCTEVVRLSESPLLVIVNTGVSSKAVVEPLVIKKSCRNKKWEPPTEQVFCFAVLAARQGGVPKMCA